MHSDPHTLDLVINRSIIVDQVASFLYAVGKIPDRVEVTNIQFGELFGVGIPELVPLKVFLKSKEVHKPKEDGTET